MNTDLSFLPFFFTEPVYLIPESDSISKHEPLSGAHHEKPEVKIAARGKFGKQVLLVVDDSEDEILNESDSGFLQKILKAVNLTEEDVAILNVHHNTDEQLPEVLIRFPFKVLISFGVNAAPLLGYTNATPYKLSQGQQKIRLLVDSLPLIEKDQQKKVKLWENLQLLFVRS